MNNESESGDNLKHKRNVIVNIYDGREDKNEQSLFFVETIKNCL